MRRFSVLLFLALVACGRSQNPDVLSTSVHVYPSDPIAAGWNESFADDNESEVFKLINDTHDRELSHLHFTTISIPINEDQILDANDVSRRPEDRAHDNTQTQLDQLALKDTARAYSHRRRPPPRARPKPKPKITSRNFTNWDGVLTGSDVASIRLGTSISGPTPYERSSAEIFVPASIAKSITANRALDVLGADFRFETKVTWNQSGGIASNMVVIGSGDPTFGSADFKDEHFDRLRNLVRDLKKSGVTEVRGAIHFSSADPRWDYPVHAPGVEPRDSGWCYGALSQAFNLHSNCATVVVRNNGTANWRDSRIKVPIKTAITNGRTTSLSRQIYFDERGSLSGFGITGTIAKRQREFAIALPVPNVKTWFSNVFISNLSELAITYSAETQGTRSGSSKSASTFSAKLSEILVPMLKESDNFLADTLFKRAALNSNPNQPMREASQGLLAEGIRQWTDQVGFPHMKNEVLIMDGAGLSRENRSTPRAFLALQRAQMLGQNFRSVWRALPIAGVDGTLKNRLKSSNTRGIVRAKTGTLRGSYQLAGYMPQFNPDGTAKTFVPFVILTSTPEGFGQKVFGLQEKILVRLGQLINPTLPPVNARRP